MIHFGGRSGCAESWLTESSRVGCFELRRAQRHRRQVGKIFDEVFGILDREQIIVAGLGINPIARRDHPVGSQRGDDVVHDFLCVQAKFAGALAVNVHFQRRIIHVLRHQHVADARQRADLLGDLRRDVVRAFHVRCRSPECPAARACPVQDGIHQAAGLEIGGRPAATPFATARAPGSCIHNCRADGSSFRPDLHERGVRAGVGRVDGGKAGRDADVGDNDFQILRRHNFFANDVLHLLRPIRRSVPSRVPVGALRLMTNWPGSVRGK